MMFSKSCEYAIKSCIFIAQFTDQNRCVSVKEIAKHIKAPEHFVSKILQRLSRKKIITSVKGPNGGFCMDSVQINKPIIDIVELIDGDGLLSSCILGLDQCNSSNLCPMHHEFQKIKHNIRNLLYNNTIKDFNDLVAQNEAVLFLN